QQTDQESRHDACYAVHEVGAGIRTQARSCDQETADDEETDDRPSTEIRAVESGRPVVARGEESVRDEHEERQDQSEQVQTVGAVGEFSRLVQRTTHFRRFRWAISSSER